MIDLNCNKLKMVLFEGANSCLRLPEAEKDCTPRFKVGEYHGQSRFSWQRSCPK